MRSGPLVGKVATSPLPSQGSPPLQSGGGKSEVAHLWAKWLRHPCRLRDPHRFRAGGTIRSGPLVGKVATPPLLYRGSPPLQSGGGKSEVAHLWANWLRHPSRLGDPHRFTAGGNQKWPTCGQSGYITPAVSGIPAASERGGKSEVAHLWAKWLRQPCHLRDPHRFTAGGGGGGNQKWPTCGQIGYATPAVSGTPTAAERGAKSEVAHLWAKWLRHPRNLGIPTASERGEKSEVAHLWAKWLRHPCRLGDPHRFRAGGESKVAHLWAKWLRHPCRLRDPHRFTAGGGGGSSEVAHLWANCLRHPCRIGDPRRFTAGGGKSRSGPVVGKVATSPLPSRGSVPAASERGGKSEVAHLWAKWLRHPCHLRDPHRFTAGGGGGNQKWPTCGQIGYATPAVSGTPTAAERGAKSEVAQLWAKWLRHPRNLGIPTASERGEKSEVAHLWAKWLRHPCRLGDPHRFRAGGESKVAHLWAKWLRHPCRLGDPRRCRAGGEIRSGPLVGKVATSPLLSRGSQALQSGGGSLKWPTCGQSGYVTLPSVSGIPPAAERGGNQKWPTCGQIGYVSPAVSGIPTAAERGGKSEVAHLWAKWLRHPCRLGDPHRCRAGGQIRSGPLVGQDWLCHPCRLGDPHRFRAGAEIGSGPLVGKLSTSPLLYRGSPPLQSGGGNQKWPTCGQSGYVTPAVSGIPTASERGEK